ncbi:hypothetical protein BL250_17055 [Erwinia sp. OLTSP20]|uniref:DUF2509 family protein n=1 Tax=unclassified Erwinia TaxID=2622719 RepID=UPI000C182A7D|nr:MULTISPECIES: DUF2509 family protein [unclassified Erwinia]PIJ49035.1 hypothetical protein BV501_15130 [Erwinia sp. OAMSP11]PIJ75029.1 hypothetical protein BK416_02750 [Erwinia sp. OLSSP12]PIJ79720.1 hypothetical protein BLD47_13755 [Erwinia sp. OLCASP19]PIJ80505.1 hypothetical protein BLD46_15600 [Erwinia sp. OLMTSP26]PIJ82620.1 hypothetical protein BLD49_15495 [Erwinia sp. OLMDSP33]
MWQQQGSSALSMVMLLLLATVMVMQSNLQQLSAGWFSVATEHRFIHQQADASSALAWGIRRQWQTGPDWHCQTFRRYRWRACLLMIGKDEGIMRGDGGPGTLSLWRWVDVRQGQLRPQPRGWIDYCPLADHCTP